LVTKKKIEQVVRMLNIRPIPLFTAGAKKRLETLTKKYQLPREPPLGRALQTVYFGHRDLWLRGHRGAKALKRSAATINTATKEYMSVLGANSDFAQMLSDGIDTTGATAANLPDINMLVRILQLILFNSNVARRAKATRGRGINALAVTVADELHRLYRQYFPLPPRRSLKGVSPSDARNEFVRDAMQLLDLDLTEDSIRTYRQKRHTRRITSQRKQGDILPN
jgi:hypothetical protein